MEIKLFLSASILAVLFCDSLQALSKFQRAKKLHTHTELSDEETKAVSTLTDMTHFNEVLDKILVPRVVGTPSHDAVADFIAKSMEDLEWHVERDEFEDMTPSFGKLKFQNIIAKLNPEAERFLVLACHYDSKYVREHYFEGATDSAVPCSMLINLAKVMQNELNQAKQRNDVSLALLFFDGEEAFVQWGPKDSIYGARHLATKWEQRLYPEENVDGTNNLDRMDMLVLLDLIGTRNPKFYNYFPKTARWFNRLAEAEEKLQEMGQLRGIYRRRYFDTRYYGALIEDDHIPFMRKDVPILHIIPTPFPDVWHKPSDNRAALDMDTIENLNKIFRVFVAEYLNLSL